MSSFFWGGGFEIMFFLVFALIVGSFVLMLVRGVSQWHKNNQSPRLTVLAVIVTKRMNVSRHHHHHAGTQGTAHGNMHTTTSTSYYVTFQVESGDRIELSVSGGEYGMLVEGDQGRLSFQGTRYLGFDRERMD